MSNLGGGEAGSAAAGIADAQAAAQVSEAFGGEVLTVDQAKARYPEERVALAVTRRDGRGYAVAGRIIAHTPDREAAYAAIAEYAQTHPGGDFALLYSGELALPPEEDVLL